ncbi:MAG: hypothetical protein PHP45_05890 [Elusimicrobiales bacterium]|nr:hypothetical protein [Elusimicrobiales bacterium]
MYIIVSCEKAKKYGPYRFLPKSAIQEPLNQLRFFAEKNRDYHQFDNLFRGFGIKTCGFLPIRLKAFFANNKASMSRHFALYRVSEQPIESSRYSPVVVKDQRKRGRPVGLAFHLRVFNIPSFFKRRKARASAAGWPSV